MAATQDQLQKPGRTRRFTGPALTFVAAIVCAGIALYPSRHGTPSDSWDAAMDRMVEGIGLLVAAGILALIAIIWLVVILRRQRD